MSRKIIGVIGGSGLYDVDGIGDVKELEVDTPFGKPSDKLKEGVLDGTKMVFLPRHGTGHVFSPSEINYRANIFAMKKLGVTHIVSVSAVGSMRENLAPGDFVVVDQYIDRTKGVRESTFFSEGIVAHVGFADPVCRSLSKQVYEATKETGRRTHFGGTYVCMEGPQFSTRAESNLYRSWGVDVIGMTAIPECKLAREAEICYSTLALVTDYDCWKTEEAAVSVETVLATLKDNSDGAKEVIKSLPRVISSDDVCSCSSALKYAIITNSEMIDNNIKNDLEPILRKYY